VRLLILSIARADRFAFGGRESGVATPVPDDRPRVERRDPSLLARTLFAGAQLLPALRARGSESRLRMLGIGRGYAAEDGKRFKPRAL